MREFLINNGHWIGMAVLAVLFLIANIATRKELPFKQAKQKIIAAAIFVSKIDGQRILGDVEKEFSNFMDKHCDEFLSLLKSKHLVSLRDNINTDNIREIGRLFAEFKNRKEHSTLAVWNT